jgi:hypothetical protein
VIASGRTGRLAAPRDGVDEVVERHDRVGALHERHLPAERVDGMQMSGAACTTGALESVSA